MMDLRLTTLTAPPVHIVGSGDRAAAAAILCFQEWLGLDATDSQHALISPGELWSSHRQLFDQLLAALGCEDEGTLEDLRETLAMLLGKRILPSLLVKRTFDVLFHVRQ